MKSATGSGSAPAKTVTQEVEQPMQAWKLATVVLLSLAVAASPLSAANFSQSHRELTGTASWYNNGSGFYGAAGPQLRHGDWRGSYVRVCTNDQCIKVQLTDWCQCYKGTERERLIDLSLDAFRSLASPSRGLVRVTVNSFVPPATDTVPYRTYMARVRAV